MQQIITSNRQLITGHATRSLWSPLRRTVKQMAARYLLLAVLAAGVLLLVAGASSRCPTTGRSSAVRGQRLRGRGNKLRNDRWVFGDPASDAYLVKVSWADIVRHVMVTGAA